MPTTLIQKLKDRGRRADPSPSTLQTTRQHVGNASLWRIDHFENGPRHSTPLVRYEPRAIGERIEGNPPPPERGDDALFASRLKTEADRPKEAKPKVREIFDWIDPEKKIVRLPEDFAATLKKNKAQAAFFNMLSFTKRKEYVEWIR
jgi:hypothetical protein